MVRIYESNYKDIPIVDLPESGDLVVCPDQRIDGTWALAKVSEDIFRPISIGIFWTKEQAITCAELMDGLI